LEAALLQLLAQLAEEHLDPLLGLDVAGGLAVHSGRAGPLVPPHPIPRRHKEGGIGDKVVEIIKPVLRITGRPSVQLGLDLQYPVLGRQERRP